MQTVRYSGTLRIKELIQKVCPLIAELSNSAPTIQDTQSSQTIDLTLAESGNKKVSCKGRRQLEVFSQNKEAPLSSQQIKRMSMQTCTIQYNAFYL